MSKNRIEWVDISKGILIILVVIGHIITTGVIHTCIYSFHLFAFIYISGFFYKKKSSLKRYIYSECKKLLPKFFLYAIIWIVFSYVYNFLLFNNKIDNMISIKDYAIKSFITLILGNGNITGISLGAIWYIPMLLSIKLLYGIIDNIFEKSHIIVDILCIVFFICGVYILNGINNFPWYLSNALSAIIFFHLGNRTWEKLNANISNIATKKFFISMIFSFFVIICVGKNIEIVNLGRNLYSCVPLILINIFFGIVFVISFSLIVERLFFGYISCILQYFGKISLQIMGWHSEIRIILQHFFLFIGISNKYINAILVLFFTLFLCWIIDIVSKKSLLFCEDKFRKKVYND